MWFDNVKITGLASGGSLAIDDAGTGTIPDTCDNTAACTTVNSRVAVLPYPRNDRNLDPRPANYCSDTTPEFCDFDDDGATDSTASQATSDAPGRAFVFTGIESSADACLAGALEYRFRNVSTGQVIRDWLTDPAVTVNPVNSATFALDVRCSADPGCSDTVTFDLSVTGEPVTDCFTDSLLIASDFETITWAADPNAACPAVFDTVRSTDAQFTSPTCIDENGTDLQTVDSTEPGLGTAFFYLSRHDGESYSSQGPREQDRSGISGCN
jgi:hypothetical protein